MTVAAVRKPSPNRSRFALPIGLTGPEYGARSEFAEELKLSHVVRAGE
jgi:hypothetical protein